MRQVKCITYEVSWNGVMAPSPSCLGIWVANSICFWYGVMSDSGRGFWRHAVSRTWARRQVPPRQVPQNG